MIEKFIPINGLEGYYEISNTGKVKSLKRVINKSNGKIQTVKERIIRNGTGTNGYYFANCRKDNKSLFLYVHRLVALHFIPAMGNKPMVNHIDGNKLNNNVNNLQWCTHSENMQHAYDTGLQTSKAGVNNGNYKHGKYIMQP